MVHVASHDTAYQGSLDDNGRMPNLNLSDGSLQYEIAGQGEPVLFIQGVGVTGSGWRPQVEQLRSEFQCLSFDNRGIGGSNSKNGELTIEKMAADARALMDHAGWESAHVAGHSMGGLIAQQLALDAPQRVKSLSLICTFSRGPEAARMTPWVMWMGLRTRLGTKPMRRQAFLEMLFTPQYRASAPSEELARRVAPIIGRDLADQPAVMMKQLRAMSRHDCSERLKQLAAIPTMVASAELDPIAQPAYGRRLSQLIPGARYTEIREASHGVTIQSPQRVNDLLRGHFSSARRGPQS